MFVNLDRVDEKSPVPNSPNPLCPNCNASPARTSDVSNLRLSNANPLASLGLANSAYVEEETEEPLPA